MPTARRLQSTYVSMSISSVPLCLTFFYSGRSTTPGRAWCRSLRTRSVSAGSNPQSCIPEGTAVAEASAVPCPMPVSTLYLFTNNAGDLTVVSGTTMLSFPKANGTSDTLSQDSALSSPSRPGCPSESGSAWSACRKDCDLGRLLRYTHLQWPFSRPT